MSDFIQDYCCTKEQAEQLVALGVRPISLFKYRPDGTVFKLDGWQVWESYDGRTVPCWTLGEFVMMYNAIGWRPIDSNFEVKAAVERLIEIITEAIGWRKEKYIAEINAYLQSKLPNGNNA